MVGEKKEPELQAITHSLAEVTSRLEQRKAELEDTCSKVTNEVRGARPIDEPELESNNYATALRSILGRLRAVDEEQHGSITILQGFL